MKKLYQFQQIISLLFLSLVFQGAFAWATNVQSVSLDFYHEQANGHFTRINNPKLGRRTLGNTVTTEYVFLPETTLHFAVNSSTPGGTLVLELYGRPEPVWYAVGIPDSSVPPVAIVPESFGKYEIPLTAGMLNNGTLQHITLEDLVDETTLLSKGSAYTEFYFGVYVSGYNGISEVDAYLNNTQVGVKVFDDSYREGFQLPVLYAHPDWTPESAHIQFETDGGMASFTDLGTLNNHPYHGALSNYRYRLTDRDNDEHVVARVWEFYQLNAGGALVGSFSGEGSAGEVCEFTSQDVDFIYNPSANWPLMLVICRRYDDRGMISIGSYSLSDLGTDAFQYRVAYDPAQYEGLELYLGRRESLSDPMVGPLPLSQMNIPNPSYLYVIPYSGQFVNYPSANPEDLQYRIRYAFPNEITVTDETWRNLKLHDSNGHLLVSNFKEIDATSPDNYPVSVWWQFKTVYGTSNWTIQPVELERLNQPQAPAIEVDWSDLPDSLLPGTPFSVNVNAAAPNGLTSDYVGKFSLWVYNPENFQQKAQIYSGIHPCLFYSNWGQFNSRTFEGFQIPQTVNNWDLGENGRLAIRMKFAWLLWADSSLGCDSSTISNPLNDFHSLFYSDIEGAYFTAVSSEATSVIQPEQGDFEIQLQEQNPVVYDPSGDVNFEVFLQRSGEASPSQVSWRFINGSGEYWVNGAWASPSSPPAFAQVWPNATDVFSQRWAWHPASGLLEPAHRTNTAIDLPFSALGGDNLLQNFFDGAMQVQLTLEVRMAFSSGDPVIRTKTFTVRPQVNDTLVLGMEMKTGGQLLGHLHERFDALPDLEWTIPTLTNLAGSIRVALFKQNATSPNTWDMMFCEELNEGLAPPNPGSNYFSSYSAVLEPNQGLTYTLTAETDCGLYQVFQGEGAGSYQLRVSSQTCSGDWAQAFTSEITINPSQSFRMRFHYRDHLGSSTVSRAYSPAFESTTLAGSAPFKLTQGNQTVTLYAQPEKATNFTPFGKPMGDVNEEPNPRYTDHEFDAESGLNYMKGRYQLANFAKFNRPDPMRDWDWENPSSINLYQYVRNNPVMSWDPDGFEGAGVRQGIRERAILEAKTPVERERRIEEFREFNAANANGAVIAGSLLLGGPSVVAVARGAGVMVLEELSGVPLINPRTALKEIKDLWRSAKNFFRKNSDEMGDLAADANKKAQQATSETGCFIAGTLVLTKEGYRPIEELQAGDLVWSKDEFTGEEAWKPVVQTFRTYPTTLVHLTYQVDGENHQIVGTLEHPFWIKELGKFIEMGDLRLGNKLYLPVEGEAFVVALSLEFAPAESTFRTYNFEVEEFHTYFVAPIGVKNHPIWVHNEYSGAENIQPTSRAARRDAMRQSNTPTSRSATSQTGPNGQRQTVVEGSDGKPRVQTQHSADKDHPNPHWHDANPKVDKETGEMLKNSHGQVKYKKPGSTTSEYKE